MSGNTVNDTYKKDVPSSIRELDLQPGVSFMANGRKYIVSDTFTIGRFERVVQMEEELMILGDRNSWHDTALKAMELINQYKPGDAHTMLYNKIESDQKNGKLLPFTLRVCTAYINYEGEDLGYLTDEQIQEKIHDWSEEGLDVRPFLVFALNVFGQLIQNYKQPILNILQQTQSVKEAMQENMEKGTDSLTK